jgi:hypothetical protein
VETTFNERTDSYTGNIHVYVHRQLIREAVFVWNEIYAFTHIHTHVTLLFDVEYISRRRDLCACRPSSPKNRVSDIHPFLHTGSARWVYILVRTSSSTPATQDTELAKKIKTRRFSLPSSVRVGLSVIIRHDTPERASWDYPTSIFMCTI